MTELEPVARIDPEALKELEKWPTASATVWSGKAHHRFTEAAEPLVTLSSAQSAIAERDARIAELSDAVEFTLSDGARLLRKQDVQGVCPDPDDCFYFGERVRCGPCAVKASAAKGVEIDDTHSHLPEVCRIRRELKAANARAEAAEALLKEAGESENSLLSKLKVMRGVYAMQNEQYTSRALHNIITEFEASRAARSLMSKIGERNGE
jgi:hypothetical protein